MIVHYKESVLERLKNRMKFIIYVIKSYLKLEPCGYCGKSNDDGDMCYKCWKKL